MIINYCYYNENLSFLYPPFRLILARVKKMTPKDTLYITQLPRHSDRFVS